jgi:magnesium chelatase subunit I
MVQSTQGKIEFDTMDDEDSDQVIAALISLAVRQSFMEHVVLEEAGAIVEAFASEAVVHTGDDLADQDYLDVLAVMPALNTAARRVAGEGASDGVVASATEFVLEGLHLTKRLAKDALYRSRNR